MKPNNLEIIFNSGKYRQILMLPEVPLKIIFLFGEKELILREKLNKHGLYVISHQRGFSVTDVNSETDQELKASDEKLCDTKQISLNLGSDKNISVEWFQESPTLTKNQYLDTTKFQKFTNCLEKLNNLNTTDVEIHKNNSDLPIIEEQSTSFHFLEKSTTEENLSKNVAWVGGPIINQETVCSQNKRSSILTVNQNEKVTTHEKTNQPSKCQLETVAKQNSLIKDSTIYSKTNNDTDHNQDEIAFSQEKLCDDETPLSPSNQSDMVTEFGYSGSEVCNDDENDIDCPSSAATKNNQTGQEVTNACSNTEKSGRYLRKCVFCLKSERVLFKFPKDFERSDLWAKISGRKWVLKATPVERRRFLVCSKHFTKNDFRTPKHHFLKVDAVPTQNLPNISESSRLEQQNAETFGRLKTKLHLALSNSSPDAATSNISLHKAPKLQKRVATRMLAMQK